MTQAGRSPLDPWIEAELATSERRTIVVDAFNVLHAVMLSGARDGAWWGREARERLLERVCAWPDPGDELWVVFDGSQPAWSVRAVPVGRASAAPIGAESSGGVPGAARRGGPIIHCLFVESADDWIVRRARRAATPERTIVVSADRKVAGRARSAGCAVWTPRAFVSRCGGKRVGGPQERDDSAAADGGAPLAPRPSPNVVS